MSTTEDRRFLIGVKQPSKFAVSYRCTATIEIFSGGDVWSFEKPTVSVTHETVFFFDLPVHRDSLRASMIWTLRKYACSMLCMLHGVLHTKTDKWARYYCLCNKVILWEFKPFWLPLFTAKQFTVLTKTEPGYMHLYRVFIINFFLLLSKKKFLFTFK